MNNLGSIEEKKESLLITEQEGLNKIKNFINNRESIQVKINNSTLELKVHSFQKICKIVGILPEEFIIIKTNKSVLLL
mgnify:CR=1 FL=1